MLSALCRLLGLEVLSVSRHGSWSCFLGVPEANVEDTVKSFTSREDAEAFAAGKAVASKSDKATKFYAVAIGNPPGIYTDWAEASKAITGTKGPKYKKFEKRVEAVAFMKAYADEKTIDALGEEALAEVLPPKELEPVYQDDLHVKEVNDALVIYTDGSSLANGHRGARAGVGVFFGHNDPRNVSERLQGEPQTNQRAELMAILRALEIAPLKQKVRICTDSQYSINCVSVWAEGWARKGWKTTGNTEVKNQDLIRSILAKMEEKRAAGGDTIYRWVKGHASDRRNVMADQLAVKGANS